MESEKMPSNEWEEFTVRVKKDPSHPHHGTDIELNGVRYRRADLCASAGDAEKKAAFNELNHIVGIDWDASDREIADWVRENYGTIRRLLGGGK